MWFKNLSLYRFTKPFQISSEDLESALQEKKFRKCSKQSANSYGWISPLGPKNKQLTHSIKDFTIFSACKEEKILPSSVIKEQLEERVESIEFEQSRKVYNKEKKTLKDDIIMELLPKAFTKRQITTAYIDFHSGWFIINTPSISKAEELTSFLRKTLSTLPIKTPELTQNPSQIMTNWIKTPLSLNHPFSLGYDCELKNVSENSAKIHFKNQDLQSNEIQAHINKDMQVSKLALQWDNQQQFILSDQFIIQRVKLCDLMEEERKNINATNDIEKFDADFSLMALSNRRLINELIATLGGELR